MMDVVEEPKERATTTVTSMSIRGISAEPIDDFNLRQTQAITVVIIGSLSETGMAFISPQQCRKYFWGIGNVPYSIQPELKPLLVYEATNEQLGFPGDAIASTSPWPELWQIEGFEPKPWRGVFTFTHKHKVLFSKTLSFRITELPRLRPHIVIDRRTRELRDE